MQTNQPASERSRWRTVLRRAGICLAIVVILSLLVVQSIRAFPKPFGRSTPTIHQTTPTVTMSPSWLLAPHDIQTIQYLANQIALAGVPIRVVIMEVPGNPINIGADANERLNFYPVESKKGAEDGLIMLVEVPATDHTKTQVAFVTGRNFYPNGGLSPAALTMIKYQYIQPLINKNTIGAAIIAGLNWVAWTNEFESSPRVQPVSWQKTVARLVDGVLAPLLALYTLALLALSVRTRRRDRRIKAEESQPPNGRDIPRDSVHLGALARGRVDDPVMVGVLLQLVAQRAISVYGKGLSASSIQLLDAGRCRTEPQREMYALLASIADSEYGRISADTLRQLPDLWSPLRHRIADHFETSGLFTPPVPPADRLLRRLCFIGLVLAAIALVVATVSMARWGILAGAVLALIASVVWWWSRHRRFETDAARASVHSPDRYLPRDDNEAIELAIFRWIVTLDFSPARLLGGAAQASAATDIIRATATRLNTTILGVYAA